MRFTKFISLIGVAQATLTYKGVDWSSATIEENSHVSYKSSSGSSESLEKILVSSGVNTVRQRVWVDPSDGNYNLDYNLALAKRANAAGLGIYLDLHFSDTWADPSHQAIPSGWPSSIDDLAWQLYNYTKDVSNAFANEDLTPEIISIGNEITAGMLFDTGSTDNMDHLAQLLGSAAWGIKDSDLKTQPQIMVHLDNGWNWETQKWWYESVLAKGSFNISSFDIMGVSYYPFYNAEATLSNLKTSLTNMASTWGKKIVVAETDWPTSCPDPKYTFPSDLQSIPFSAAGQTTFIEKVAELVSGIDGGAGVFYWEPAWIDNAALGSSCADNTMFSSDGTALSSLSVFSNI